MSDQIISLTDEAIVKVQELILLEAEGKGLRLGVKGGGCSGLSYSLTFEDEKERDNILPYDGFKVLIDPKSAIYLKGITLDHESGLNGKGFIFTNPNASNTCGCGESFTV